MHLPFLSGKILLSLPHTEFSMFVRLRFSVHKFHQTKVLGGLCPLTLKTILFLVFLLGSHSNSFYVFSFANC